MCWPVPSAVSVVGRSLQPLMSPEELASTEQLAEQMLQPGSSGQQLQAMLEKRRDSSDNWVTHTLLSFSCEVFPLMLLHLRF